MKPTYELLIHYTNGSDDVLPFSKFVDVRDFYQNRISYTGGRVRRVELRNTLGGSVRAIWDINWDAISKAEGLAS